MLIWKQWYKKWEKQRNLPKKIIFSSLMVSIILHTHCDFNKLSLKAYDIGVFH